MPKICIGVIFVKFLETHDFSIRTEFNDILWTCFIYVILLVVRLCIKSLCHYTCRLLFIDVNRVMLQNWLWILSLLAIIKLIDWLLNWHINDIFLGGWTLPFAFDYLRIIDNAWCFFIDDFLLINRLRKHANLALGNIACWDHSWRASINFYELVILKLLRIHWKWNSWLIHWLILLESILWCLNIWYLILCCKGPWWLRILNLHWRCISSVLIQHRWLKLLKSVVEVFWIFHWFITRI